MKTVVICQPRLLHYRIGLFQRLRQACSERGINLVLLHGQASPQEATKKDEGALPWAHRVENRFFGTSPEMVWQPFPSEFRSADLVVVMQESRILSNYPLLIRRAFSGPKVAYWGHGVNFQSTSPKGIRERWKRIMLQRVDWWFAYTQVTADILRRAGYPSERVTCLNNAIDNDSFIADLRAVDDDRLKAIKDEVGVGGGPIGLFCGSLYIDKKIDMLISAADQIRSSVPQFQLIIVGDGPCAGEVAAALDNRPWLKWVGMRKGQEKAAFFRLADVVLNPGAVGLHVLDSFCAGVPMITTAEARHGPEIAYLRNNENGLVVSAGAQAYAEKVTAILLDRQRLDALKRGAIEDAAQFTLDSMVRRFADGLEQCLKA